MRIAAQAIVRSLVFAAVVFAAVPRAHAAVDFSRDILPILSDKCFHCHGPDAKARKANLRFDTKEGAFRLRKGKSVIVPGESAASELVRRITAEDESERMPPPEANRTLSEKQIALLKKWVEDGATWGRHWAFEPPRRPPVPIPPTPALPHKGGGRQFPPPLWGRAGVGGIGREPISMRLSSHDWSRKACGPRWKHREKPGCAA